MRTEKEETMKMDELINSIDCDHQVQVKITRQKNLSPD